MVREIRIYFEGDSALRRGFESFLSEFRERAKTLSVKWSLIACGPRLKAYKSFRHALADHPEAFNVLLVDSEAAVDLAPWDHLKQRAGDGWDRPGMATENQCHLMVPMMEAWFVADPDTLAIYYGQGFLRNSLPSPHEVETKSKREIKKGINAATRHSKKRIYHKTKHAPDLLAELTSIDVRKAADHCDRLFRTLGEILEMPAS